jgi:antibiotic biosynthesis monooxygenase (ABM) superfamily enzyme
MKKKNKYEKPQPFAAETKDHRFAGTFEVLIPIEGRNKPLRVPQQFDTMQAAEAFIHSPDGKDLIADMVEEEEKVRER